MTTSPPILRNSAFALPLAVAPAFWVSPVHGVGALLSSVFLLGNFWVLSVLGPKVVTGLAKEEGDPWLGLWAGAIALKFLLLLVVFTGMVRVFPPAAIAVGFLPLLVGTLFTAVQMAREPEPAASEA